MKKITKYILCCFMILSVINITSVSAALNIEKLSIYSSLDCDYGFTPRFIKNITVAEPFGMTNYEEDAWMDNSDGTDDGNWSLDKRQTVRITKNSQKGKIGCLYKNVGTYQGKVIDLKLTVTDWTFVREKGTYQGKDTYPTIIFYMDYIRAQPQAYTFKGLKYKMEFFEHGSTTPMKIRFHATFLDIDNHELIKLDSADGITDAFLFQDTVLFNTSDTIYCDEGVADNVDKTNWVTVFGDTSSFSFTYSRNTEEEADYSNPLGSRKFYWWTFDSKSVTYFDTPPLTEKVTYNDVSETTATIQHNKRFYYDIYTTIPYESSEYRYDSFEISSQLQNGIDLDDILTYVYDDENTNVKNLFNVSVNTITGNVKFTLKNPSSASFYGKSYNFRIGVRRKVGYDLSPYLNDGIKDDGTAWVVNQSKLNVEGNGRSSTISNAVYTRFQHSITSSVVNGNISGNREKANAALNYTYNYSPKNNNYIMQSIKIDGKNRTDLLGSSSYEFKNIEENHTIDVVYEPKCTITETIKGDDGVAGTETTVFNTNSFVYDTYVTISDMAVNNKFSKFVVYKKLKPGLDYSSIKTSVRRNDNPSKDIFSMFDISVNTDTGVVTFTLNYADDDFYTLNADGTQKVYDFRISVKKKTDYDLSPYLDDGIKDDGYAWVPGESKLTINQPSGNYEVKSNSTYVKFQHSITSSVVNGTINGSREKANASWDYTYSYNPTSNDYLLQSVKVDGVKRSLTTYASSFIFKNLSANHTIDVVYEPKCTITETIKGDDGVPGTETTVFNTNSFVYDTYVTISDMAVNNKFSKFVVYKKLKPGLDYSSIKTSVRRNDKPSKDISSMFDVSVDTTGVVTFTLNYADDDFYTLNADGTQKVYDFRISVKKKSGHDLSPYLDDGIKDDGYAWVPGESKLTINQPSGNYEVKSNSTYVKFQHSIISSVVGGTINSSKYKINATNDETYQYRPADSDYVLKSVIVDGVNQDITKYPSSYVFSNINDNHTIDVVYAKEFDIITSKKGKGEITASIYSIPKGENRLISYMPASGWYTYSVTVDGIAIDLNTYPKEYMFKDINSDHNVVVEFKPHSSLTITDSIDVNETYWWSGEPTFLYKIEGYDTNNNHRMLHVYLKFTESTPIKNNRMTLSKQVTQLPAGNYTVSRVDVSRYFGTIDEVENGEVLTTEVAKVDTVGKNASVVYHSNRTRYDKFDHNDFETIALEE